MRTALFHNDVITIGRSKFRVWIEKPTVIKRESVIRFGGRAIPSGETKSTSTQTTFLFFEQPKPHLEVKPQEQAIKIEESEDDYDSTATTDMKSDAKSQNNSSDEINNDETNADEYMTSEVSSIDMDHSESESEPDDDKPYSPTDTPMDLDEWSPEVLSYRETDESNSEDSYKFEMIKRIIEEHYAII